jgi:hypothetical protein
MRISNPRVFVGDQPLATREYVISITKAGNDYLSGLLSANINALEEKVSQWLTGDNSDNPAGLSGRLCIFKPRHR